MAKVLSKAEQGAVLLLLRPVINVTDDQFFEFCQLNRDVRLERTSGGDLVIMPPTGGGTGRRSILLGM
jgi:Uma2 family endonuclease